MIKINQLKLPVGHSQKDLEDKIRKTLRIPSKETFHYEVMRRSLDARKKPSLFYVYCIYVTIRQENSIVKKLHQPSVSLVTETGYRFSEMGQERLNRRPVIVGAGPCGLFAAWQLTLAGYAPLILERGKQVEDRSADVERFWKTGILQPDSNVQFGEGGAGTFSDGKLNTVVKDPSGRNRYVLETFVKFGAPSDILYDAKPHIGTDILAKVIKNMRDYLIKHGAEFRFQTCLKDIQIKENALQALVTEDDTVIPADVAILALGHSARDTFTMLHRHQLPMEAKNFAVGFRVEHPQQMIDDAMYGNGKRNQSILGWCLRGGSGRLVSLSADERCMERLVSEQFGGLFHRLLCSSLEESRWRIRTGRADRRCGTSGSGKYERQYLLEQGRGLLYSDCFRQQRNISTGCQLDT